MLDWLKRLFKKGEQDIGSDLRGFMDIEIEIKEVKPAKHNIRDKKGRFIKKGKKNGNR